MKKFLRWVQDQLSDGLDRSTVGAMTLFGCFCCIAYLTIKEGGSDTVDDLLTTAMIVSATLMGVTSIADIFKTKTKIVQTATETTITEQPVNKSEECEA